VDKPEAKSKPRAKHGIQDLSNSITFQNEQEYKPKSACGEDLRNNYGKYPKV